MKKKLYLLIITVFTLNSSLFCTQEKKTSARKPITVGSVATATGAAKVLKPSTTRRIINSDQKKAADARSTAITLALGRKSAQNKVAPASIYSITNYTPASGLSKDPYNDYHDKQAALDDYTKETITSAVSAYLKSNPKVNKEDAIDKFIKAFESQSNKYTARYRIINPSSHNDEATEAFSDLLSTNQNKLEDEHSPCLCF